MGGGDAYDAAEDEDNGVQGPVRAPSDGEASVAVAPAPPTLPLAAVVLARPPGVTRTSSGSQPAGEGSPPAAAGSRRGSSSAKGVPIFIEPSSDESSDDGLHG